MQTTQTLQAHIDKRASSRLDADLEALCKLVREHSILGNVQDTMPKLKYLKTAAKPADGHKAPEPEVWETSDPYHLFRFEKDRYNSGRFQSTTYMDALRAFLLPQYIERETKDFLEKIDTMKTELDYLSDNAKLRGDE